MPLPRATGERIYANDIAAILSEGRLPYSPDNRSMIRMHLEELTRSFPHIYVYVDTYATVYRSPTTLIVAHGLVPFRYTVKGKQEIFHVPLELWLPSDYPSLPPIAYVKRVENMVYSTRKSLPYKLDPSDGLLHTDYMDHWTYPTSNLLDLTQTIGILFGDGPPLYTQPERRTSDGAQELTHYLAPTSNPVHGGGGVVAGGDGGGGFSPLPSRAGAALWGLGASSSSSIPPLVEQPQQHTPPPPPPPPQQQQQDIPVHRPEPTVSSQEIVNECRAVAIAALNVRLHASLSSRAKAVLAEAERLQAKKKELLERRSVIENTLSSLQAQRAGLDNAASQLHAAGVRLDAWLAANEPKVERLEGMKGMINPDDVFVTTDVLSQQLLDLMSQDEAIKDVMDELKEGLRLRRRTGLSVEAFVLQMRELARRQFKVRHLQQKVKEKMNGGVATAVGGAQNAAWYTGFISNPMTAARQ